MTSVTDALKKGEAILAESAVAEPRREASSLLTLATRRTKAFFYAHPDYLLSDSETQYFDSLLARRASREPLQYIAGVQEFYGLEFELTPDVLIPRPETEMAVEQALALLARHEINSLCEVGIGSGCIAVSILHHAHRCRATGLDVSVEALAVARRNAIKHDVLDRLSLVESDVFESLAEERFELIISNPPYVPAGDLDGLEAEVRDHEPKVALTDGADGLSIIRRIVEGAPRYLRPRGLLMLEIGFDQSRTVAEMFHHAYWEEPELRPDLQGIPRLVLCRLK